MGSPARPARPTRPTRPIRQTGSGPTPAATGHCKWRVRASSYFSGRPIAPTSGRSHWGQKLCACCGRAPVAPRMARRVGRRRAAAWGRRPAADITLEPLFCANQGPNETRYRKSLTGPLDNQIRRSCAIGTGYRLAPVGQQQQPRASLLPVS